ncbi:hydrolase, partial [Rhizobium ruizarguesonis]
RALAPHSGRQVVENTASISTSLKAAGGTIILVTVGFSPDYADSVNQPADEALHFPEGGLPAAALAVPPEIAALAADVHIVK